MDGRRDNHTSLCEGPRHLKLIPTVYVPVFPRRDCEWQNGAARFLCQQNRPHFRHVSGTLRAINSEGGGTPGAHQPHHLDQCACAAPRAGSARCSVAKSLNEPRYIFAIKAARGHHHDATLLPEMGGEKDPVVPEGIYRNAI